MLGAGLDALARQLLRQESAGSSWIEDLVIGQRRLARAATAFVPPPPERAAELAGVSETAAARALGALEQAGILAPSQQRWGRRWEARELFDLLDAFERGVATPGHASRPAAPSRTDPPLTFEGSRRP